MLYSAITDAADINKTELEVQKAEMMTASSDKHKSGSADRDAGLPKDMSPFSTRGRQRVLPNHNSICLSQPGTESSPDETETAGFLVTKFRATG